MHIKSIKIQGFKSFADKLELDFDKGISAIVGPNGSGKSNVVDAILWVLGEQSVKTLRGDSSMADVIFSGSKSRDEQKKASVAILFDNADRMLPTEFNEVEVKRIIYSSGENEYYINNSRVRLKDVTDLLIDITSKFNIVTQGNINALVENKSSERRVLFESAAGVLKYKKRKEESIKKLDGTKENLTRVNLIIKELLNTLTPLEKQKMDAENYLKIKSELENVEVSLIANDITNLTDKFNKLKTENQNLAKRIDEFSNKNSDSLEKMKLEKLKINDKIDELNKKTTNLKSEISSLEGQKLVMVERSKYNLDNSTIDENILKNNEKKLNLEKDISTLEKELSTEKNNLQGNIRKLNELSDEEIKTKVKLGNVQNEYNKHSNEILLLQNKIKIEDSNLENNSFLPKSVSSVINNPTLEGIHDTISNVIDVNEAHTLAINTALGVSANFIIVDNMSSAKNAINYLKEGRLGRATFFPIDTIKSRHISKDIEYTISSLPGYIGVASDLVSFNNLYTNIIENQLGNVIIADQIDDMFDIAKILDYKYKVVSLQGDIIYAGGSVSGGTTKELHDKSNLTKLRKELSVKETNLSSLEMSLKAEESKLSIINTNLDDLRKKITELRIIIEAKEKTFNALKNDYQDALNNCKDLSDLKDNKINDSLNKLLEDINNKKKDVELYEVELKDLKSKKFDIENDISNEEKILQEKNAEYHRIEMSISNNDIEIGKYEVRIDNLLNTLSNDYNITYEYALNNYTLDIDIEPARHLVSKLKGQLRLLNNVNIGSIDEYNRLKKRFDFLDKQRNDLETSSNELLKIIDEMDIIMKEKFKTTFDQIASEFSKVFRVMFKGGNGLLKLTDENDILNTGINIMAVPPGKKLNSTASLSGGEKALTAICLIFAILNVKPAPFIVLDEVEAALDEENVAMFGEYLSNIKNNSQFILITHKKKMMEYADILYGITMQESGVSKLVSVKLEDMK